MSYLASYFVSNLHSYNVDDKQLVRVISIVSLFDETKLETMFSNYLRYL